jgi:hypothetical protein
MLTRKTYIENRKVLGNSGEDTTEINVTQPITCLWVELRATNGATSNKIHTLAEYISQIDVVDGSDVLYSLDGQEALGMAVQQIGYIPQQLVVEFPGGQQSLNIPIMFGRFIGDKEYALNPLKHLNLQVRIRWDLTALNGIAATGWATGTLRWSVVAEVIENNAVPKGFFMKKEHYSWTTAASGDTRIDLPTDYPYRALMVRNYLAANQITTVINNLELNLDQSRTIPFNMRMTDILRYHSPTNQRLVYKHWLHMHNAETAYFLLKYLESTSFVPNAGDAVWGYNNNGRGEGTVSLFTAGAADANDRDVICLVEGYAPMGCVIIPFGDQYDPSEWLPAPAYKSVRLIATNGAAAGVAAVCLEQLRSY